MVIIIGKTNAEKQEENNLEKFIEVAKPFLSKNEEISKGILGSISLRKKKKFITMGSHLATINIENHKIYLNNENYLELTKQLANTYESLFGGKKWMIKTEYE